jgi:hypothetical protein
MTLGTEPGNPDSAPSSDLRLVDLVAHVVDRRETRVRVDQFFD